MGFFPPFVSGVVADFSESGFDCSLIFKDSKAAVQTKDSIPCRVERVIRGSLEEQQGVRTTSESLWRLWLPLDYASYLKEGAVVSASWRPEVTFPDASTVKYFLTDNGKPVSENSQILFHAKTVD